MKNLRTLGIAGALVAAGLVGGTLILVAGYLVSRLPTAGTGVP